MSEKAAVFTPGRICISLTALATCVGPYIADWNETHVFNPRWPPHAKFHNGQTMSMGLCLGLATTYYLWRPQYSKDSLFTAAILASMYWVTQASAILYPGTLMTDPEFGTNAPQKKLIPVLLGLVGFGYWSESRRLG